MRLVAYSEVLAGVSDAMGWNRDADGLPALDAEEWQGAKRAISKALATVWDAAFWPDLCRIELRRFHPSYDDGEPVAAGDFRFYPPTGQYYQALRDSVGGNAPATEITPGVWETNLDYWADAARSIDANAYDATFAYQQGDRAYYAPTGLFYQVHTADVAGTDPTDTTVWGPISNLDPRVPWTQAGLLPMGRIRGVYRDNPATYRGARRVPYTETVNGVQIRHASIQEVWIHFQLRPPKFTGTHYSDTATYTPSDTEGAGVATLEVSMASQMGIPGRTALRAVASHKNRQIQYLLYLVTEDDGQGGEWEFRSASTDADDGATVLKPDNIDAADPGRWHLLVNPS